MSDIQSAIGLAQLRKLDRMNQQRTEIVARYNEVFQGMEEVETPPDRNDSHHAWHLYVLRLNLEQLEIDRAEFIAKMRDHAIGCSVHFIPIPLHPYYQQVLEMRDSCTRALAEYPRLVSLPVYSRMTDHDVERVIAAVRDTLFRNRKHRVLAAAAV
jgi:dTDP-4-amino-4,6-dideoxygalactose transaminase